MQSIAKGHLLVLFLSATMRIFARSSAFLPLGTQRRLRGYGASVATWDRRMHFSTPSLQVKHAEDDNRETWQPIQQLTRTMIRRLKLAPMRVELSKRGLDTSGTRNELMERLLETVDKVTSRKSVKQEQAETINAEGGCPSLDCDKTYVLRVKGSSNSSYKFSGVGLVLYDASTVQEVWVARKFLSRNCSPFEADYRAAIIGLQCVFELGARKIVLQTDNDVMIKQVKGEYNVAKQNLQELCTMLSKVLSAFPKSEMTLLSAEENTRAKNLALRAVGTKKTVGLPSDDDIHDNEEKEEVPSSYEVTDSVSESLPVEQSLPDEDADEDLTFHEHESPTIISPDKTYLLQFDGGARGNPGIAGSGMVLYDLDNMQELWCGWKYLGEDATNNAAEYNGLLLGIQCARSLGVRKLRAEGDSLLIVKHVTGKYKAREPNMKKLLEAVKNAAQNLDSFEINHIPRAMNSRADQLANQAMDTRESFGFDEFD